MTGKRAKLWYLASTLGVLLLAGARSLYAVVGQGGASQGQRPDAPQATAPPPPQAPVVPDDDDDRRRKRRRLFIILGLGLVLAANVAFGTCYFLTRTPVTQLPVVKALTRDVAPHFLYSIYGVNRPMGVAVSPDGSRLYVTENGGDRLVHVYDTSGRHLGTLPPPHEEVGGRSPVYVAVDMEGNVYVSDRIVNGLLIYSPDGELVGTLPAPSEDEIFAPLGVEVDGRNRLYLTDVSTEHQRVWVFDASREPELSFGTEGRDEGELSFPNSALADDKGRIYVSDGNNTRVQVFDAQGNAVTSFGEAGRVTVSLPRGMALDGDDRLYVADAVNHNVWVFDVAEAEPSLLFTFGSYGIGDGQLRFPNDVAVDSTGHVFVADRENNRIQVWSY